MDAANQRAHDNTMALLWGVLSGGRDDLVELFERHAERGPDDELYIRVDTAADLVVDRGLDTPVQAEADNCGRCWACMDAADITPMGYVLCPKCGNKRCPHAADHNLDCGQSNESGQPGATRYPKSLDPGSTP